MWVDIRAGNALFMKVYMLIALIFAFLFCLYFGMRYVSWLEKKNIKQPLKDEVAQVYEQDDTPGSE